MAATASNVPVTAPEPEAVGVGRLLADHLGADVMVIDVTGSCDWTDALVIATVTSVTHMSGLSRRLHEYLGGRDIHPRSGHKQRASSGWTLVDCYDFVVHLMDAETRAFYELERLWFMGTVLFQSSKSSNSAS